MALPIIPGYYPGQIDGALIGLKVNGASIECETSSEFSFEVEMLPASSVMSGRFSESIAGKISWTMTVSGNLLLKTVPADGKTLLKSVPLGEVIGLEWKTISGVSPFFKITGNALIQSGGFQAPGKGRSTWNISFKGTGPFECDWEEFALIINAMPAPADKPYVVDTTNW